MVRRATLVGAMLLVFAITITSAANAQQNSDKNSDKSQQSGNGQQYYGYGMGPGMMGYGPGYGMGPGMMGYGGYGPGYGMGPGMMGYGGYGAGYGMGPGMMGYGCAPWMTSHGWMGPGTTGYGPGYGAGAEGSGTPQQPANLNLTLEQVRNNMERWLKASGNPHIKLGKVVQKDANTITADVVTTDKDALVQRYEINRHTGFTQPAE
jgi:hypothetical protein